MLADDGSRRGHGSTTFCAQTPGTGSMRGPSFETLDALRRVLSDREWRVYLDLEAVVNARLAYALAVVVPWAFAQGATRASKEGA